MNWTVDLTVSYTPCPPEHAAAWWAAIALIATLSQPGAELLKPDQPGTASQTQSM